MNKPLLWLVALSSLTACAGQKYRVDVGPFFARARGDVALQDAGGSLQLGQVQNDLDGNLGLGETEPSPYLRGQWERDRHRVRLHGFGIDSEGAGTLAGNYGGILGNSQVTSELTFLSIAANYGYEVLRGPRHRVAVGGQIGFYSLDVEARSTPGFESVETDALVPMPFAEAEALLGKFTLGANFAWMSASLGDASGIYLDAEAYARWSAAPDFDFFAGYRFVSLDAAGKATSRDFDADVDVQGFFFGAGIRF
jgi:hypothetical protein